MRASCTAAPVGGLRDRFETTIAISTLVEEVVEPATNVTIGSAVAARVEPPGVSKYFRLVFRVGVGTLSRG